MQGDGGGGVEFMSSGGGNCWGFAFPPEVAVPLLKEIEKGGPDNDKLSQNLAEEIINLFIDEDFMGVEDKHRSPPDSEGGYFKLRPGVPAPHSRGITPILQQGKQYSLKWISVPASAYKSPSCHYVKMKGEGRGQYLALAAVGEVPTRKNPMTFKVYEADGQIVKLRSKPDDEHSVILQYTFDVESKGGNLVTLKSATGTGNWCSPDKDGRVRCDTFHDESDRANTAEEATYEVTELVEHTGNALKTVDVPCQVFAAPLEIRYNGRLLFELKKDIKCPSGSAAGEGELLAETVVDGHVPPSSNVVKMIKWKNRQIGGEAPGGEELYSLFNQFERVDKRTPWATPQTGNEGYIINAANSYINTQCRKRDPLFTSERHKRRRETEHAQHKPERHTLELQADSDRTVQKAVLTLRADEANAKIPESSEQIIDKDDVLPPTHADGVVMSADNLGPDHSDYYQGSTQGVLSGGESGATARIKLNYGQAISDSHDLLFVSTVQDRPFDCTGTAWSWRNNRSGRTHKQGEVCNAMVKQYKELANKAKTNSGIWPWEEKGNGLDMSDGPAHPTLRLYLAKWNAKVEDDSRAAAIKGIKKTAEGNDEDICTGDSCVIPKCKWNYKSIRGRTNMVAEIAQVELSDQLDSKIRESVSSLCYLELGCEHVIEAPWATLMGTFGINSIRGPYTTSENEPATWPKECYEGTPAVQKACDAHSGKEGRQQCHCEFPDDMRVSGEKKNAMKKNPNLWMLANAKKLAPSPAASSPAPSSALSPAPSPAAKQPAQERAEFFNEKGNPHGNSVRNVLFGCRTRAKRDEGSRKQGWADKKWVRVGERTTKERMPKCEACIAKLDELFDRMGSLMSDSVLKADQALEEENAKTQKNIRLFEGILSASSGLAGNLVPNIAGIAKSGEINSWEKAWKQKGDLANIAKEGLWDNFLDPLIKAIEDKEVGDAHLANGGVKGREGTTIAKKLAPSPAASSPAPSSAFSPAPSPAAEQRQVNIGFLGNPLTEADDKYEKIQKTMTDVIKVSGDVYKVTGDIVKFFGGNIPDEGKVRPWLERAGGLAKCALGIGSAVATSGALAGVAVTACVPFLAKVVGDILRWALAKPEDRNVRMAPPAFLDEMQWTAQFLKEIEQKAGRGLSRSSEDLTMVSWLNQRISETKYPRDPP